jgi:hypothetical protein
MDDRATLKRFDALARKLAQHERRKRVTESSATTADRIMYAMAAIRDAASPGARKIIKQQYGWKS